MVTLLQMLYQLDRGLLRLLALLLDLQQVVGADLQVVLVLILGRCMLLERGLCLMEAALEVLVAGKDLLGCIYLAV